MKEIILNNKSYLLVEVPDNATNFRFAGNETYLFCTLNNIDTPVIHYDFLNCQILSTIEDILKDENICKRLVEVYTSETLDIFGRVITLYRDYKNVIIDFDFECAIDSFQSWLESIELDITKSWVLILKV